MRVQASFPIGLGRQSPRHLGVCTGNHVQGKKNPIKVHLPRSNSGPWNSSDVQHTPRGEFSSVQRGGVKSRDQPGRNQKEASGLKGSGVNPLRVMHHSGAAWRARVAVVSTHGRRTIGRATSNFMSQTTNQLTLSGSLRY